MQYLQTNGQVFSHANQLQHVDNRYLRHDYCMVHSIHMGCSRTVGEKLVVGNLNSLHTTVREHAIKKRIHIETMEHVFSCSQFARSLVVWHQPPILEKFEIL